MNMFHNTKEVILRGGIRSMIRIILILPVTVAACTLDVFVLKPGNNFIHPSVLQYKYVSWLQKTSQND